MNPKIKAEWVAALRSGNYCQGQNQLRDGDTFCCLGVLCDLYAKATGEQWHNGCIHEFDVYLPPEVQEWAGLNERPDLLADYNDGRGLPVHDFNQIADLIEKDF